MKNLIILLVVIVISTVDLDRSFGASKMIDFNINGCYIGAFVSWKTVDDGHPWETTAADINEFEKLIGRKISIATYYRAFSYKGKPYYFPNDFFETLKKNGSVLFLSWEPRDWDTTSPSYYEKSLLPDIIAGKYDDYIDKWAEEIKSLGQPLLLRFAQEMNVESFSWSGARNGGPAGPAVYVAAYQYIHDRFKKVGVNNVLWVWTPIMWGLPFEVWNHYTNYYPGDKYVDIIAMDEYNWGASQPWAKWQSFNGMYWQLYSELTHLYPDKTLIIGEFSSSEKGGDKANWIKEAFKAIKEKYPKIKAFVWHHIDNRSATINNLLENSDWRINSSPECVAAAREALTNKYYFDRARFIESGGGIQCQKGVSLGQIQ